MIRRWFLTLMICVAWGALAAQVAVRAQDATPPSSAPTTETVAARLALPAQDDGLPGVGPLRRYDWFQQLWLERRSTWDARRDADQGAVVFLGDSITQGWGDDCGRQFDEMKIANRGISGDTTRGMLLRLDDDVLALHPAAVVLLMGTNDLEEQAEPPVIVENLRAILSRLKAHRADMPIVLCLVFPSSATKSRPANKIKELNDLYAQAVKGDTQVTLVDTWKLFADDQGDAPESEFPDRLHPNAAGYARWGAALRPVLATLGLIETRDDRFDLEAGFESLFNGHDLTGWGFRPTSAADIEASRRWRASDPQAAAWPVVTAPVAFDGQTKSSDGRYVALHGRLVVTTPSEGRRIQQLWTTREFPGNFTLKLEFRATPNADSGVFLRLPQLQCRDYRLAGPYKQLQTYRPQDWNELEVVVRDGVAECRCNGEVLEAAFAVPATGPIGLEGDRGQMEYRRLRIRHDAPR